MQLKTDQIHVEDPVLRMQAVTIKNQTWILALTKALFLKFHEHGSTFSVWSCKTLYIPRCFRDPVESEKIIIGSLQSEKIVSLESEKLGPYRSIPGTW